MLQVAVGHQGIHQPPDRVDVQLQLGADLRQRQLQLVLIEAVDDIDRPLDRLNHPYLFLRHFGSLAISVRPIGKPPGTGPFLCILQ